MLRTLSLPLLLLLAAGACLDAEGLDLELGTDQESIINGDPIAPANSGLPMLSDSGGICSSVLYDNNWIVTAAHCVPSYDDHAFNGDGQVLIKFPGQTSQHAKAVAVDSVGRALVAGSVWDGSVNRFGLARVRGNGTPDPYFASGAGRVTTSFPGADTAAARAVAVDAQQRSVVAGYAHTAAGHVLGLARYTSAGVLDSSFGGDGRVLANVPNTTSEEVNSIAIDRQGRIVVGGTGRFNDRSVFVVARFAATGVYD